MEEQIKKEDVVENVELNNEQLPVEIDTLPLEESTKDIIEQIIKEQDVEHIKDLSKLFNVNQVKKNLVRVVKLNNLLDKVQDQAIERFENRPDEVSNKELLDYMQIVQNSIDKAQKSIETLDATPLIQVSNQEINVNVNNTLDKESKEKVLDVVQKLIKFAKNSEPTIDKPVMVDLGDDKTNEESEQ